jgi:hypothetical protein
MKLTITTLPDNQLITMTVYYLIVSHNNNVLKYYIHVTSVVEPEPQGAGTFGWSRSRNIEVSAPPPAPGFSSGSAKVVKKIE